VSKQLIQSIEAAGKKLETLVMPDGTRLALLLYGARGVALYPSGSDESFFWSNPEINEPERAKTLFASEGWHNTGGDRTWIAPELDTFFTDEKLDKYWQPRKLDMSDYAVQRTGGGVQLSQEMKLHLARSNGNVDLRLTKWFGPAANPLRHDRDAAKSLGSLQYAGYTQRITLESLDKVFQPSALVGIWNLIQLPEGGEMVATTYSRAVPQPCFGNIPPDHVAVDDRSVRFYTDIPSSHKIAVKSSATCGRAAYFYGSGEVRSLVVRNFFVNPSGEYVDVQRVDLNDFGYSVQLCRVDEPGIGSFCELEYHAPALGALPDPARSEDVSQVWGFRGPRAAIDDVAMKLLGVKTTR
jgi:hypothetical protein